MSMFFECFIIVIIGAAIDNGKLYGVKNFYTMNYLLRIFRIPQLLVFNTYKRLVFFSLCGLKVCFPFVQAGLNELYLLENTHVSKSGCIVEM